MNQIVAAALLAIIMLTVAASSSSEEESAGPTAATGRNKAAEPWQTIYNGTYGFQYFSGVAASLADFAGQIMQGENDAQPQTPFGGILLSMTDMESITGVPIIPGSFVQAISLYGDNLILQEGVTFLGKVNDPTPFVADAKVLKIGSGGWRDISMDYNAACKDVKGAILGGFAEDTENKLLVSVLTLKKDETFSRLVMSDYSDGVYTARYWHDFRELGDFTREVALLGQGDSKTFCIVQYGDYTSCSMSRLHAISVDKHAEYAWALFRMPKPWTYLGASEDQVYYMDENSSVLAMDLQGSETDIGELSTGPIRRIGEEAVLCQTYSVSNEGDQN